MTFRRNCTRCENCDKRLTATTMVTLRQDDEGHILCAQCADKRKEISAGELRAALDQNFIALTQLQLIVDHRDGLRNRMDLITEDERKRGRIALAESRELMVKLWAQVDQTGKAQ